MAYNRLKQRKTRFDGGLRSDPPGGARTQDPILKRDVLYLLS